MTGASSVPPASCGGARVSVWMLAACTLLFPAFALAAYTDAVLLTNGDRLKGEVKGLRQGQLEFKTDSMSTVYVKWNRVAELTAPGTFQVETADGARYDGSLEAAGRGKLGVNIGLTVVALAFGDVVRITPLKRRFWSRIDGSVDLGASYTQSSGVGQGSLSVDIRTRRRTYEVSAAFDTTITVQPDQPVSSRTALSGSYLWLLRNRWFVPGIAILERNTDLGIALRSSIGGGIGRYFLQSNRSLWGASAGVLGNQERPVEGEPSENLEAFLTTGYSFFTYDRPKTTIEASFTLFPSLNVEGRFRTDLKTTVKRELLKDFTVWFTYYDTYDNKPPGGSSSTHDFGVTVSIGWVF